MDLETALAPVDGSEAAMEALACAVAVAERYDASVHVLHVFGEGVVRGLEVGDLEPSDLAAETDRVMARAEELADGVALTYSTACGFSLERKLQHPGSVILDAADDAAVDVVVMPREPESGDPAAVLGSAAEYVVAYASQPVLAV